MTAVAERPVAPPPVDDRHGGWRPALGYWLLVYKRTWRGTVTSSILSPVLYLLALGVGLGSYVHGGSGRVDGVKYAVFLAPGLLAASAMQTAIGEATWSVMDAIKWRKSYIAMLAGPLEVVDVMLGHLAFMLMRVVMGAIIFAIVITAFGLAHDPLGLVLAVLAAILTGAAFITPAAAFAATQERESGFSMVYRFGVVPLFLFSGTFYPVAQLPVALRPIAWVTPLWHGVALSRDLVLGRGGIGVELGHVAYLLGLTVVGLLVARRTYQRRLRW
jgi:lipooligosaccharide transport system permease protein